MLICYRIYLIFLQVFAGINAPLILRYIKDKMKADYRTDEEGQTLLNKHEITEPELYCEKNKRIQRMCVNSRCQKHSLHCQEKECDQCGRNNHKHCSSVTLQSVSTLLTDSNRLVKDLTIKFSKLQKKLIEELQRSSCQLAQKYHLGRLDDEDRRIVEEIYKNRNIKCLTGKQASEFHQRLVANDQKANESAHVLLTTYETFINKVIEQALALKKGLFESFVKAMAPPKINQIDNSFISIDSNILKNPHFSTHFEFKINFGNRIRQHTQFILNALSKPKKLELLYRASENAFSAAAFHQKCDNVPDTLTIVRTEFGKTIAGFTKYTWNKVKDNWVSDSGRHAFLLSLDLKQKMVPVSDQNLIYCGSSYGPTFASDLIIRDQCHNNTDSLANFPLYYNCEGANKYTNNQDSYRSFSGAMSGKNFRVVEYEVFRVIYK